MVFSLFFLLKKLVNNDLNSFFKYFKLQNVENPEVILLFPLSKIIQHMPIWSPLCVIYFLLDVLFTFNPLKYSCT